MAKINTDKLMELLGNKKHDREESIADARKQIIELNKRLAHLEGNLYEINYLIEYIENDVI